MISRRQPIGTEQAETPDFSLKRRIFSTPTLISIAVTVALLVVLISRFSIDLDSTWQTIRQSNPILYMMAMAVHYSTFLFRGARWRMLLKSAGVAEVAPLPSVSAASRLVLLGWFANSITWFRLGDAYRAYAYTTESSAPLARSAGTILAERVMDMFLVFVLLAAGFGLLYADPDLRPSETLLLVGLGLAAVSGLILLAMQIFQRPLAQLLSGRILRAYNSFHEGTMRSFRAPSLVLFMGLLAWLAEVCRLLLVVQAAGLDVGFGLVLVVPVASALLTAVPLTPGGLGIVETGIVGLLTLAMSRENAVSVALLDRSISYFSIILVGTLALAFHQRVVARRALSSPMTQRRLAEESGGRTSS